MFKQLSDIRETQQGRVTYNFKDGTKQVSPVNNVIFYDRNNRKVNLNNIVELFQSTAHDLGAISFEF